MVKMLKDKKSDKGVPRCLIFDSQVWKKARELANEDGRSISSYLREQIKVLYDRNKKLSSIS